MDFLGSKILEVKDLRVYFETDEGIARVVDGVSYGVFGGEMVSIVGESGSGKSILSLSVMGLMGRGAVLEGGIWFKGRGILGMEERRLRKLRGREVSMIFQEPMTSLNPVYSIGDQLSEVFRLHGGLGRKGSKKASIDILERVGIKGGEGRLRSYPHELSGGMRQRVMIGMAMGCGPDLLIADEPTTALDVSVQWQILELMKGFQEERGMAIQLITHNLGIVGEFSDRVLVMYGGEMVEWGLVEDVFRYPLHPYTRGLLNSVPSLGKRGKELEEIGGQVPKATNYPEYGCRFRGRCRYRREECEDNFEVWEVGGGHFVRCILR